MTAHYLMLRSYGDSVISLNLLSALPASCDVRILGTRAACDIAGLLRFSRFPIDPVLDDVAAFFDLRRAGPLRAMSELLQVRRRLKAVLQCGDDVLFEHADWRDRWILPDIAGTRSMRPSRHESAYEDRRQMLHRAFAVLVPLADAAAPRGPARTLVLHPGARVPFKRLPHSLVAAVVEQARDRGIEVSLIDPEASHAALAARVHHYLPAPSLQQAVAALRQADAYVGADSLFLHLAYHYGIPACALVAHEKVYFAPPGMIRQGRCPTFAQAVDRLAGFLDGHDDAAAR